MPRWLRVIRGMIGTGLTFAAGVGVVGSILGLVGLLLGELSWDDLRMVAKLSVVAFLVGVGFSGVLAIAARGRRLETLSLRYVTALGAGGGLLYLLFIAAAKRGQGVVRLERHRQPDDPHTPGRWIGRRYADPCPKSRACAEVWRGITQPG